MSTRIRDRRKFDVVEGKIDLQKDDRINCHQVPLGNGHAKFSCWLWKIGEPRQPSFQMGEFEELFVEDATGRIKNAVVEPRPIEYRPQVEFSYGLNADHSCWVVPMGERDIAKKMDCRKS